MIDLNPALQSHCIINFAVSDAGEKLRPKRINQIANLYSISKSYAEKFCRPSTGEGATGKPNPLDRLGWLLFCVWDFCPAAVVLIVQHVGAIYQMLTNTPQKEITNLELRRELIAALAALDDATEATELQQLAKLKAKLDSAIAQRSVIVTPDSPKPKFTPRALANLAIATKGRSL